MKRAKRKATTVQDVVSAAIPGADASLAQFVLWSRTPFPVGQVSARDIFKAAYRWKRAIVRGRRLCDWCDRITGAEELLCAHCAAALSREKRTPELAREMP